MLRYSPFRVSFYEYYVDFLDFFTGGTLWFCRRNVILDRKRVFMLRFTLNEYEYYVEFTRKRQYSAVRASSDGISPRSNGGFSGSVAE